METSRGGGTVQGAVNQQGDQYGWWDGAGIGQPAWRSVGVVGRCRDRSTSVEISRGGGMVQG